MDILERKRGDGNLRLVSTGMTRVRSLAVSIVGAAADSSAGCDASEWQLLVGEKFTQNATPFSARIANCVEETTRLFLAVLAAPNNPNAVRHIIT